MKSYVSLFLSTFISTLYTLLVFFSTVCFERNGVLDSLTSHISEGFFLIIIITICLLVNILLTFFLVKRNWQKTVSFILCVSFIFGCLCILVIGKNHIIGDYLYNAYIDLFYHGVRYSSEDVPQQLFTYIPRIMTLAFFIGFLLSCILIAIRKNKVA